jgi:hypothetical protein
MFPTSPARDTISTCWGARLKAMQAARPARAREAAASARCQVRRAPEHAAASTGFGMARSVGPGSSMDESRPTLLGVESRRFPPGARRNPGSAGELAAIAALWRAARDARCLATPACARSSEPLDASTRVHRADRERARRPTRETSKPNSRVGEGSARRAPSPPPGRCTPARQRP